MVAAIWGEELGAFEALGFAGFALLGVASGLRGGEAVLTAWRVEVEGASLRGCGICCSLGFCGHLGSGASVLADRSL